MLIYHPAYDAYHCVFRMLLIANTVQELEIDKARLLDFYLLFPSLVSTIRLPPGVSRIKKQAASLRNEYRDPISPKGVFKEIGHIQDAAIRCLTGSNLIDREAYQAGFIVRTNDDLPKNLAGNLDDYRHKQEPVSTFILGELAEFPLLGLDGLKSRSGLMEFRYDVA